MARSLFDSVRGAVRRQMAPLIVFSFLANLLLLASSIYLLQVYDRVLSSGSLNTLLWLTVIVVLAIAVYALLEQARRRLLSRIAAWIDTELSAPVIAQSIVRRLRGGVPAEGGLADVAELRGFFGGEAILAFLDAPWAPGFVAIIWLIHPWLGVIALTGAILLFACALVNDRLTRARQRQATVEVRRAQTEAGQYIDGAETVAGLGMTRPLLARWRTAHQAAYDANIMVSDTTAGLLNLSRGLRLTIQVVIIGAGAFLVLQGDITAGAMIAASIVLGRALSPVERSISAWRSYVASKAGMHNLKRLFDGLDPRPDPVALPRPDGRLAVEGVSVAPPAGGAPILENVSFHLEPGEACGILGPSGSGKSTLCRLLVGVWETKEGHVRLDGADVADWEPDDRARHIGYLPQQVELFGGTVADNIARMHRSSDAEIIAAAKLADVHEMILRLPDGYETDVGMHGRRLSGGQRQRIGLARALFGNPVLLVLDEPNASLDTDGDHALLQTLAHLKTLGRTVVVVTHQPAMLRSVDKVLLLRNGRVDTFGARDEVVKLMPRSRLVVRPSPPDLPQVMDPMR